jgi:hypothetical protein
VHWEWLALKRSPSAEFERLGKVFLQSDKLNCEGPLRSKASSWQRVGHFRFAPISSEAIGMSQTCQQRKSRLFDHFVANGRALQRWSFGQPGLPQSFFVSQKVFGPPKRA